MNQELEKRIEETTPLISVIVPVYNILDYLERCVNSLCSQTYENLEILLVDDGSTDGTSELCDKLGEKDTRIRVFHKENGGSSSARNLGIAHSRGAYIGFVDSDDYVEPQMYEELYQCIAEFQADIAQIGRDEIDEKGNLMPNICEPPAERTFINSQDFMRELLMHRGDCSFCTKLVKRELFGNMQFPIGELNEDFKLLVQMLPRIKGIVSLPKQTYHVFYRIGSNTRKADKKAFSRVYGDCVVNADMVEKLVEENYPELKKVAFRFGIFQRLEYLLHIPVEQMEPGMQQYKQIVKYLRRNWWNSMRNPILTTKNKVYHTVFAIAPKQVRVVHKKLKKL